jgi:DNA-binding transcriptional LysR family regulator
VDRLNAMEIFVSVVDAGSFSNAAKLLDVGQPAISKSVAQLESRLGVQLLFRSTRGLSPTEAGQRFYERARITIDEANQAEDAARDSAAGLSGRLRVSAAVTFARLHIIPSLPSFLKAHPNLDIDIVLDDRNVDLLEQGVDVSLRMGVLDDSRMTARRIARNRRTVVATPAYLRAQGIPQTPADLCEHRAIVYDRTGGGSEWSFMRDGAEMRVAVAARIRVTAAEGVRAAVLADMGLAITTEWMFRPELRNGEVVEVLQDWELPALDLWAVFPTGRQASAKARAFVAFVEEVLNRPVESERG